jgi:hypothetical protein
VLTSYIGVLSVSRYVLRCLDIRRVILPLCRCLPIMRTPDTCSTNICYIDLFLKHAYLLFRLCVFKASTYSLIFFKTVLQKEMFGRHRFMVKKAVKVVDYYSGMYSTSRYGEPLLVPFKVAQNYPCGQLMASA